MSLTQVLGETADIVAVTKPPCMPVHVAGQHRKNTVAGLLQVSSPFHPPPPPCWPLTPCQPASLLPRLRWPSVMFAGRIA